MHSDKTIAVKQDSTRHPKTNLFFKKWAAYLDELCAVEMGEAVFVTLWVVPDLGLFAGRLQRIVQCLGPVHQGVLSRVGCPSVSYS